LYKRICQVSSQTWSQAAEDQWKAGLLKNTATPEDAQEEYYCVPKQGGGAYINRLLIESRMVDAPVIRYTGTEAFNTWPEHIRMPEIDDWCKETLLPHLLKLPSNLMHAFGEDFARSGDLTVIAPVTIEQNLVRTVPFLVELKNLPFKNQEQILFYIADRLPRLIGGKLDARGNGQYLAEQAKFKYGSGRIEEVMLSQSWYLSNMPKLKAAFEDDTIRIPRDADVLSDIRAIQVINGIPKIHDGKTDEAKQRHGDAAIAIALAYVASQMDYSEYAYEPVTAANFQRNDDDINLGFRGRDLL
jgi:phage FluMu gp28-like protein